MRAFEQARDSAAAAGFEVFGTVEEVPSEARLVVSTSGAGNLREEQLLRLPDNAVLVREGPERTSST